MRVVVGVDGQGRDNKGVPSLYGEAGRLDLVDAVAAEHDIHFVKVMGVRLDGVIGVEKGAHVPIGVGEVAVFVTVKGNVHGVVLLF